MCLIKNLIREDQIFGYPDNLIIEVDEENHENYESDDKKKEKTCLKSITLKIFDVIPMILILIFLNF